MRLAEAIDPAKAKAWRRRHSGDYVALSTAFWRMALVLGSAFAVICGDPNPGVTQEAKEPGANSAAQQSGKTKNEQDSGEQPDQKNRKKQDASDSEQAVGGKAKTDDASAVKDADKEKKPAASESQQGASAKGKSDEGGSPQERKDEKKEGKDEKKEEAPLSNPDHRTQDDEKPSGVTKLSLPLLSTTFHPKRSQAQRSACGSVKPPRPVPHPQHGTIRAR